MHHENELLGYHILPQEGTSDRELKEKHAKEDLTFLFADG